MRNRPAKNWNLRVIHYLLKERKVKISRMMQLVNTAASLEVSLKENEKKGQYKLQLPTGQVGPTMIFNQSSDDPVLGKIFSDVRFRYAMPLAIDRNEINESLFRPLFLHMLLQL